jgi:serine/threonine protein kinase
MPADPKLVRDLFLAAVELPAAERASFFAASVGEDAELRAAVERLLAAHEHPASVLARPAPGIPTADHAPIAERVGTMIGPYKLMEQIGEGGFGLVFVAEQTEPVRRKVALKIIKPGMDSQQVIARFEAERQALALMDHPNIARVLDADATDSGRPFFVMELVRGIPITDYCDKHQLSPHERLELFITVCQAIQHAHQKGIIHRDIKPSNVLVTSHDGKPVAKVIDFGVAKAIHQHLTERTIYTQFAQMIGTPLYMSPEQAEMSGLDIDTRSDIYSLGVVLYELLTGTTPLEKKRLREAAHDEMRRLIREEEPPKPSTRLSTSESIAAVAAQRKMEPGKLSNLLRGDLDWITMKALEKDRTRRYETANGLARDIQRYLSDEPVEACPPSAGYRLRKFARKHRAVLTTAAAFVVLLAAGAALATWQAVRATRAETLAVEANTQLDSANTELKSTNQNLDSANQNLKKTNQQLDAARQAADKAAAAEKRAADKERQATAIALTRLKEIEKANGLLESIFIDINPRLVEKGGPLLIEQLTKRLLVVADQLDAEAFGDPLTVARLQHFLGNTLHSLGEPAKAIVLHQQVRQTLAKVLGFDHPDTLTTMNNLALAYLEADKLDLALPLLEETLKLRKARLGPDHRDTLNSMNNLAMGYKAVGMMDLALPLLEETLKLRKARLGPDHRDTLTSMNNLAVGYQAAGKLDLALPLFEETLKLTKVMFGTDHPDTLQTMNSLATAHRIAGKLELALPLLEETLTLMKVKLGQNHPNTLNTMGSLFDAYLHTTQCEMALPLIDEFVIAQRKRLGADTAPFAGLVAQISLDLLGARQFPQADKLLRECLAIREKNEPGAWTTYNTQSMLGGALLGQKKHAEAEPLLLKGYEGMNARAKSIPPFGKVRLTEAAERLVQLYEATDRKDEAKKWTAVVATLDGKLDATIHDAAKTITLKAELSAAVPALIYQVRLKANVNYVIDMVSPDPMALDPFLFLQDADRKKLAEDDDGGGNLNARIVFRAPADGVYRLRATSFNGGRGPFTLTIRPKD